MNIIRKALVTREAFMIQFFGLVGAVGGLLIGIPIIGSVFSPLVKAPNNVWRDVGAVGQFKVGETVQVRFAYPVNLVSTWSGLTQNTAAWLRNDGGNHFTAFAVYCTHLGCPVRWYQTPQLFLCPCHGSVFNGDGTVAGGPAPRALFQYQTRVTNGRVEILTEKIPVVLPIGKYGFGD